VPICPSVNTSNHLFDKRTAANLGIEGPPCGGPQPAKPNAACSGQRSERGLAQLKNQIVRFPWICPKPSLQAPSIVKLTVPVALVVTWINPVN
jgi:hypothetical protein